LNDNPTLSAPDLHLALWQGRTQDTELAAISQHIYGDLSFAEAACARKAKVPWVVWAPRPIQ
jgi:hypothetical protein